MMKLMLLILIKSLKQQYDDNYYYKLGPYAVLQNIILLKTVDCDKKVALDLAFDFGDILGLKSWHRFINVLEIKNYDHYL